MICRYEIRIIATTTSGSVGPLFRVEHGFPELPDILTIKALRDEAVDHYCVLYGEDPEVTQVEAYRLTAEDVAHQINTQYEETERLSR